MRSLSVMTKPATLAALPTYNEQTSSQEVEALKGKIEYLRTVLRNLLKFHARIKIMEAMTILNISERL